MGINIDADEFQEIRYLKPPKILKQGKWSAQVLFDYTEIGKGMVSKGFTIPAWTYEEFEKKLVELYWEYVPADTMAKEFEKSKGKSGIKLVKS